MDISNFLSVHLSKSISFPLLSLVQMVGSLSRPGHAGSSARVCGLISPGMRAGIKSCMTMVNLLHFSGNSRSDSFLKKKQLTIDDTIGINFSLLQAPYSSTFHCSNGQPERHIRIPMKVGLQSRYPSHQDVVPVDRQR